MGLGVAGSPANRLEINDLILEWHMGTSDRLHIHSLGLEGLGGARVSLSGI